MHRLQNLQIVEDLFRALSKHDFAELTKHVSKNCDHWAVQDGASLPWSGHFEGPGGMRGFFEFWDQTLEQALMPEDILVEGDKVVVTGRSKNRVKANGAEVDQAWVMLFTIRAGEIVACQYFDDSAKWMPALKAG